MTELAAIILALGALVPLVTSVFQQPRWSNRTRVIVGVVVSAVVGFGVYFQQYGFNFDTPSALIASVVGVVLAAAAAYRNVWKPSTITGRIELATSRDRKNGYVEDSGDVVVAPRGNELVDNSHPVV